MSKEKDSGKRDGKQGGKQDPDDVSRDQLKDWKDLNKNAPHVGPLKKAGDKGKEET